MCTTTRVAERAGVSVGSYYQYYPNRRSLLLAVLGQHLDRVASAVENACAAQKGKTITGMIAALTQAFIDAKLEHPAASRCLYAVSEEPEGAALVAGAKSRIRSSIASMLHAAEGARFDDVEMVSLMITSAMAGPVQTMLEDDAEPCLVGSLRSHLCSLIEPYLANVSVPVPSAPSK